MHRNVVQAQQRTFALSTYSVAVSGVTMTYEMKMGLYATSPPRKFSSHATSSSAVTISAPTFCSAAAEQELVAICLPATLQCMMLLMHMN